MDIAHKETDRILTNIERRVRKEYRQASKEVEQKLDNYFAAFCRKDEAKREAVKSGEMTEHDYKQWRTSQLAVGKRWESLKEQLAQDYTNATVIARNISDGYMPEVYAINHNFATYEVETSAKVDTSYTLYSAESVERLIRENPDILPQVGRTTQELIDSGVLKKWEMKNIQSTMIQGILQGESINHLAQRMARDVGATNYKDCVKHARTMTTATQNAGRVDGFKRAEKMGIDMEQEWVAILDGRTRHEHRQLDGQRRPVGEPFEVDGYKLDYPADPKAPYYLIMNCRCTLIGQLKGFERDTKKYRQDADLDGMTYEEWKNAKTTKKKQAAEEPQAKKPQYTFTPAQTIAEAEEYARQFVVESTWSGNGIVSFKGIDVDIANGINETLTRLFTKYDLPPLRNIQPMNLRKKEFRDAKDAPFAYRGAQNGDFFFNANLVKSQKTLEKYMSDGLDAYNWCKDNVDKFTGSKRAMIETYIKAGRSLIADETENQLKAMVDHEMGHHIQHQIIARDKDFVEITKAGFKEYGVKISGYATQTRGEYIAESFSAYNNGFADIIDPKLKQIFDGLEKKV